MISACCLQIEIEVDASLQADFYQQLRLFGLVAKPTRSDSDGILGGGNLQ